MASRFSLCDRQHLEFALADRLSVEQGAALSEHLQGCAHCRSELELLAGNRDWWQDAHTFLSSSEELRAMGDTPPLAADVPASNGAADDDADDLSLDFLEPSDDPAALGRLGGYEVEAVIGRGGMGVVLKAQETALSRPVAIKVLIGHLAASAAARKRFAREARAAAAVVHDHVIPIHTVDTAGRTPYLVMPYIPGGSLQDRLDACGLLDVKEVLRIALQTAQGLAAAHAQGLVHRDIKPANILLENGVERVRITDFGLARAVDDASQTQSGFIAGTPQYMAPEQARGEPIDARADLFSLGSVMYAMCTGHPPFRADTTLAVLRRICDDEPRDVRETNPDVPAWLAAIIHKLLSKSPADRFQTADEVAELLQQWLAHLQQPTICQPPVFVVADRRGKTAASKPWPRPRRIVAAVGGVLTAALLIGAATLPQWLRDPPAPVDADALAATSRAAMPQSPMQEAPTPDRATQTPRIAVDAIDAELRQAWTETLATESALQSTGNTDESLSQAIRDLDNEVRRLELELAPQRVPAPSFLPDVVPVNP